MSRNQWRNCGRKIRCKHYFYQFRLCFPCSNQVNGIQSNGLFIWGYSTKSQVCRTTAYRFLCPVSKKQNQYPSQHRRFCWEISGQSIPAEWTIHWGKQSSQRYGVRNLINQHLSIQSFSNDSFVCRAWNESF